MAEYVKVLTEKNGAKDKNKIYTTSERGDLVLDSGSIVRILYCPYNATERKLYLSDRETEVDAQYVAESCLSSKYKSFVHYWNDETVHYVLQYYYNNSPSSDGSVDGEYKFHFSHHTVEQHSPSDSVLYIQDIRISCFRENGVWTRYEVSFLAPQWSSSYYVNKVQGTDKSYSTLRTDDRGIVNAVKDGAIEIPVLNRLTTLHAFANNDMVQLTINEYDELRFDVVLGILPDGYRPIVDLTVSNFNNKGVIKILKDTGEIKYEKLDTEGGQIYINTTFLLGGK